MSSTTREQFGITRLTSQHKDIKRLRKQYPTSIHGNKIWKSSFILMDYFKQHPIPNDWKVLELGCGWGLTAIYLNKTYGCYITAVDADKDVAPYLELHAEINNAQVTFLPAYFEKLTAKKLAEFDLIVAADVCFWDELEDIHYNLINRAIKAGVKKIVYADPIRAPFEGLIERCIEKHCADVIDVELPKPNQARGALMIIENE